MNLKRINALLESISEIVNEDGSWQEKRDAVINQASPNEITALEEFAAWFVEGSYLND